MRGVSASGRSEAAKACVRCCYYPKPDYVGDTGKLIEGIVKAVYQVENRPGWNKRAELEAEFARHRVTRQPKAGYCNDFKGNRCRHGDSCRYFRAV